MTERILILEGDDYDPTKFVEILDQFKIPNFLYEDRFDFRWYGQLKFCGCGWPVDCAAWLAKILRLLDSDEYVKPELDALVGSEMGTLFVLYVLDAMKLTEHGGSVFSSRLTDTGEKLMVDLEAEVAAQEARYSQKDS